MTSSPPDPGNAAGDAPQQHSEGIPPGEVPSAVTSGPSTISHACTAETAVDHDCAAGNPSRRSAPPWSSAREACVLIAQGYTFRTGVLVASVVGTILSGVNEGTVIASGHLDVSTWARIVTNYLVPFVVASVGYLAPFRRRRGTNR